MVTFVLLALRQLSGELADPFGQETGWARIGGGCPKHWEHLGAISEGFSLDEVIHWPAEGPTISQSQVIEGQAMFSRKGLAGLHGSGQSNQNMAEREREREPSLT